MGQDLGVDLGIEQERRDRHAEGASDLRDIEEAQIAFAALDGAHECAMDAAFVGETFLRVALRGSQFSYSLAQGPENQR